MAKQKDDFTMQQLEEAEPITPQQDTSDGLPEIVTAIADPERLPEKKPVLIEDLLRVGGKMIVQGASKSYKSFMLLSLCWAIVSGGYWLGRKCEPGRVLIINTEIDSAEEHGRANKIMQALGIDGGHAGSFYIWNLRGKLVTLEAIRETTLERYGSGYFAAIVIDPVYKLQNGDENSAEAIGRFCHELDMMAEDTGAAIIYCHHYSKGAKGGTAVLDRSSGSGVFARDADAVVDVIELEENDDIAEARRVLKYSYDATAWRASFVVRSFAPQHPISMWFKYPIHDVDNTGLLDGCKAVGAPNGNGNTRNRNIELIKEACKELIAGKDEFPRVELEQTTKLSLSTVKRCLQFVDGFETYQKTANCTMVRRSPATRS